MPPQDRPPPDAPTLPRTAFCGANLRRTLRQTAQSVFFSSLPPQFSFFLPSLGVFSWNFGGVWGRRGFTRQPENSKRAHPRVPALQTTTNPRKDLQRERERKKKRNCGGRGKKSTNFWAPHRWGPTVRSPSPSPPLHPHPPLPTFSLCLKKFGLIKFGIAAVSLCVTV